MLPPDSLFILGSKKLNKFHNSVKNTIFINMSLGPAVSGSFIKLEILARKKRIIIKLIIPYYLEQDNISEHTIRIIIKKARTVFNN